MSQTQRKKKIKFLASYPSSRSQYLQIQNKMPQRPHKTPKNQKLTKNPNPPKPNTLLKAVKKKKAVTALTYMDYVAMCENNLQSSCEAEA